MYKRLIELSDYLDKVGYVKYSNYVDQIIKKASLIESIANIVKNKFPEERENKIYGISKAFLKRNREFFDKETALDELRSIVDSTDSLTDLIKLNLYSKRKDQVDILSNIPLKEEELKQLKELGLSKKELIWFKEAFENTTGHNVRDCIDIMKVYTKNREKISLDNLKEIPNENLDLKTEHIVSFDTLVYNLQNLEGKAAKELKILNIKDDAIRDTFYIYEDSDFLVVQPRTTESSQYWAFGTKWCTGYLDDSNQYMNYTSQDEWIFYYIITKDTSDKYNPSKLMDKISLVYKKDDYNRLICVDSDNANATVNKGNVSIKKSKIKEYLGEKASKVIGAIESDAKSKNFSDVYTEKVLEDMSAEEFFSISSRFMDRKFLDKKINNMLNNKEDREEIEYIIDRGSDEDIIKTCLYRYSDKALKRVTDLDSIEFFDSGGGNQEDLKEIALTHAKKIISKDPYYLFVNKIYTSKYVMPEILEMALEKSAEISEDKVYELMSALFMSDDFYEGYITEKIKDYLLDTLSKTINIVHPDPNYQGDYTKTFFFFVRYNLDNFKKMIKILSDRDISKLLEKINTDNLFNKFIHNKIKSKSLEGVTVQDLYDVVFENQKEGEDEEIDTTNVDVDIEEDASEYDDTGM